MNAVMDQRLLAEFVLGTITTLPSGPPIGQYLTLDQAESIINDTIDYVGRYSDAAAYKYLLGHRHRLAISLTFISIAETDHASFLDVGCYGYMGFWAWRHLGYRHVEGIELLTETRNESLVRQVKVKDDQLDLTVHNFDITAPDWPLQESYNTVLFLATSRRKIDVSGRVVNILP